MRVGARLAGAKVHVGTDLPSPSLCAGTDI